jgi:hypothetical protein
VRVGSGRAARSAAALVLLLGAACSGGVSDGSGPVAPPIDTTGGGGTVPRGALTLTVTIDPEDATLASTAGVGVQGITVRVQRRGAAGAPRVVTTDATGAIRLENLLTGTYDVAIDRAVTSAELARLPAEDRDASLLTGAASVPLTAPQSASGSVSLVATRRGSLVISEVFTLTTTSASAPYGFGTYLEVYNNADTTVFLDGLVIARTALSLHRGYIDQSPCGLVNATRRLDPSHLWVEWFIQLPGSGGEYGVPPGEARVLAMDAIDHSAASPGPGQVDLTRAHFEDVASDGDPDNVTVPNVIRTWFPNSGVLGRGSRYGHGVSYALARLPAGVVSLAQLDSASLTQMTAGGVDLVYALPRAMVLDAFSQDSNLAQILASSSYAAGLRRCVPWLAPVFERAPAFIGDYAEPLATRRKTAGVTPDGREILPRTRTSARDLERAPPLLRSLRKGQ